MTIIMFMVATGTRTPIILWMMAMACDTIIAVTFMTLHALGKI